MGPSNCSSEPMVLFAGHKRLMSSLSIIMSKGTHCTGFLLNKAYRLPPSLSIHLRSCTRGSLMVRLCHSVVNAQRSPAQNQWLTLTRKTSSDGAPKSSPKSPLKSRSPIWSKCSRPWDQTRKSVDPGAYSQRSTALERNCL